MVEVPRWQWHPRRFAGHQRGEGRRRQHPLVRTAAERESRPLSPWHDDGGCAPKVRRIGFLELIVIGEVLEHHPRLREDKVSVDQKRYASARRVLRETLGLLSYRGLAQVGRASQVLEEREHSMRKGTASIGEQDHPTTTRLDARCSCVSARRPVSWAMVAGSAGKSGASALNVSGK